MFILPWKEFSDQGKFGLRAKTFNAAIGASQHLVFESKELNGF